MSPEMKERVWETVNEMIDCCDGDEFHSEGCTRMEEDEPLEYEDSDTARWKDQDRGLGDD